MCSPMSRALNIPCYSTSLQPNVVPRSDFPQFLLPGSFGRWGNRLSYRLFNWLTLLGQNQSFGAWAKTHLSKTHLSKTALPKNFDARLTRLSSFYPDAKEIPILQGFSRCIVPQPEEWSEEVAPTTGYWFRPLPKGALPPELEKFLQEGPPPIYVGFGSMPVARAESIAEEVISALRKLGRRGVLSIGWGGLRGALPSEDIFVLDSAPHELLFPAVASLCAGTTHEGRRRDYP